MASELCFRKEFEDYILKQDINEAVQSLLPDSKESLYLQFCDAYKKCLSSQKISKELISILKKAESLPDKLLSLLKTRKNLLEYDLPSTSQERKNEIINELYQNYCKNNFDYPPPHFVREKSQQNDKMVIEDEKDNAIIELTEDIIREQIQN